MKSLALFILLLCVVATAVAKDVAFGELPPGAISTNLVKEVHAEICRDHLFDPSFIKQALPANYRLALASEYAAADPGVAALLKSNKTLSTYAVGSLCFMSVGTFVVDGVRVNAEALTPMAFWWVRAAGPRDARMQGKVEWLQLASWYSRKMPQREKVLATDPLAQFVDLEVTRASSGRWRMRLPLANETIEAEVRGSGKRSKGNTVEPGFMSVPFTGKSVGSFWVITYFGHHHQSAQGQWRAKGSGVFTSALQIPGEAAAFDTFFQDGWSALSGLYKPVP